MKILCALLCVVLIWNLEAGTVVALLKSVENNHSLHMKQKQKAFLCKPYGVDTVSQLVLRADVNGSCMEYLKNFRRSDPKEKFFAVSLLYIEQQYSVEGIEDACLLHLTSGYSYSEALLEKGYARVPPGKIYKDSILNNRFMKAEKRAKSTDVGIWADVNLRNCFLLPKEE